MRFPETARRGILCRLRFSLRTILIGVMLIGIGLSATSASRRQRALVATIEHDDGIVCCGYEKTQEMPPGPKWLRDLVGDGLFFKPQRVSYGFAGLFPASDDSLQSMSQLPSLEEINLPGYSVTNEQFKYFVPLTNLRVLECDAEFATDESIIGLSRLRELRSLRILGTSISARGVAALKGLTHLESLDITSGVSNIDDQAVAELSSIHTLTSLSFDAHLATFGGLLRLASLRNLNELNLQYASISAKELIDFRAALRGVSIWSTGGPDDKEVTQPK